MFWLVCTLQIPMGLWFQVWVWEALILSTGTLHEQQILSHLQKRSLPVIHVASGHLFLKHYFLVSRNSISFIFSLFKQPVKEAENIYLGPHGAPPSQAKQQEPPTTSRKQKLKSKLKEADRKFSGTGRENKVDNLRELIGSNKLGRATMPQSSPRDWLDPHCHESQFNRHLH